MGQRRTVGEKKRDAIEAGKALTAATIALADAERSAISALRKLLASRVAKCDPKCKGYMINGERGNVERCDECASLNGYGAVVHDDLCALLPAARKALRDEMVDDY